VLWGAGATAVAAVLWLAGDEPIEVTAHGGSYRGDGAPDVALCHLRFATGIEAQLMLSALEPQETRTLTAVGSAGTATFDELDLQRPLSVCERSSGDVVALRLAAADPVGARCEEFLSRVGAPSYSSAGGREGAAVVAVVEAVQRSLEHGGLTQPVGEPAEPLEAAAPERLAEVIGLPRRSA
jgi:GFO/IDH/MocA oxidoreductase family protein